MDIKQVFCSIGLIISISVLLWLDIKKIQSGKIKLSVEDWVSVIVFYFLLYFIAGTTLYFELSKLF